MGIRRGKKMGMVVKARLIEELRYLFSTRGDFFSPEDI